MMDTCKRGRGKWRVVMIVAGVLALFLASGSAGYAYWQLQGKATINVTAAKLKPPTLTCTGITNGVRLDWSVNPPNGVTGYKLEILFSNQDARYSYMFISTSLNLEQRSYVYSGEISEDWKNLLRSAPPNDRFSVQESRWRSKFILTAYRDQWSTSASLNGGYSISSINCAT